MTINSSHSASIQLKDPARDEQNDSLDVQSTSAAPTDAPESIESSDPLPQGMLPANAMPFTPPNARRRVLEEATQGTSLPVYKAALAASESSDPSASQELPSAAARPSTPPKEYVCPQAEDTPARARESHSNRFRNGNVDERREVVVLDTLQVDIIPDDFFFSNLLPKLPAAVSECFEDIIGDLVQKNLAERTGEQGEELAWKVWDVSDKKQNEDNHFKPFEKIFLAVKESAEKRSGLIATHTYKMEPSKHPDSERDERMRPDACFVREPVKTDEEGRSSWYDIACVGEFKRGDQRKDVKDNIDKVMYGMHYIMASDACRRFVMGFTVEKDMMALWHASRSALYKCFFDFKKEPKKLVRLFLAFAFANANGQETGWDPTVTAITVDNRRQYIFDVKGTRYVTKKLLNECATDSLFGRGTRVFLVTEEGTGIELVLKDYWIDEGRWFESTIIKEMLNDVLKYCGAVAVDKVKSHIVNIVKEIDVMVGDQIDHTLDVIMGGALPSITGTEDLMSEKDIGRTGYKSVGVLSSLDGYHEKIVYMILHRAQNRSTSFRRMRHRRVLYAEYGTPIGEVKQLSKVIVLLRGVTEALQHIHEAKWVHRDISVGNVYEYEGRGLLADFEYAKRMGEGATHEVKTGTIHFMASEAIEREYNYHSARKMPVAKFFHNIIHDMESIHWVLFFILKDVDCEDKKAQESRVAIVSKLFSGETSNTDSRDKFISKAGKILYAYGLLLGDDGKDVYDRVSSLGTVLVRYYREAEAQLPDGPIDVTKFSGIHEEFITIWKDCEGFLAKQDKHLEFKLLVIQSSIPKRPAETQLNRNPKSKKSRTHEPESIQEEDEMAVESV